MSIENNDTKVEQEGAEIIKQESAEIIKQEGADTTTNSDIAATHESAIATSFSGKLAEFKRINAEFDVDFISLGIRLKLNSKGQFVFADDDTRVLHKLTGVVIKGKARFELWGEDGTPQEGELIFVKDTADEADAAFDEKCSEDEIFNQMYDKSMISQRYLLSIYAEDDNLYAINLAPSSKYEFGNYVKKLFTTKSKGVAQVITSLDTQSRKKGKNNWNVITFEYVKDLA